MDKRLNEKIEAYTTAVLQDVSLSVGRTVQMLSFIKELIYIRDGNYDAYKGIEEDAYDFLFRKGKLNEGGIL